MRVMFTFALILNIRGGDLRAVLHDVVQIVLEATAHIVQGAVAGGSHRSVGILFGRREQQSNQNFGLQDHFLVQCHSNGTYKEVTLLLFGRLLASKLEQAFLAQEKQK